MKWEVKGVPDGIAAWFEKGNSQGDQTLLIRRETPWGRVCCVPGVITGCLGWSSRTNDCWADLSCKVSLILIQDRPSGQGSRKANSRWALTCFRPFLWIISSNPHSPPIRWVFSPLHGWMNKHQCVRCWLFFFFFFSSEGAGKSLPEFQSIWLCHLYSFYHAVAHMLVWEH